jgi:hypothetical protein
MNNCKSSRYAYLEHFGYISLCSNWEYIEIKNLYDLSNEKEFKLNNYVYK